MRNSVISGSGKRPATKAEIEYAIAMLHNLGDVSFARLVAGSRVAEFDSYQPIVVTDFSQVGEELVLLVPTGTYMVPQSLFETPRRLIGMPRIQNALILQTGLPMDFKDYPVLLLADGNAQEVTNFDTGESSTLEFYAASLSKFACLQLDSQSPCVVEIAFDDEELFTSHLLDAQCTEQVDVYNVVTDSFMHGRSWVREAYGESGCRSRDVVERGIDGLHQGGLKVIDAVFNPLIRMGETLDGWLGLNHPKANSRRG